MESLALTTDDIQILWSQGILSDTAYVHLALQLEADKYGRLTAFDIPNFIMRWEYQRDETTKPKALKRKSVVIAIQLLEDLEILQTDQQLSLQLI